MSTNDKFDAKKWEVADNVPKKPVQYEFEDEGTLNKLDETALLKGETDNHSKESPRNVVIVGRDEIQKNIEKKATYRNDLNSESHEENKTKSTDSLNENTKKKKSRRIIVGLSACLVIVAIVAVSLGVYYNSSKYHFEQIIQYIDQAQFDKATEELSYIQSEINITQVKNMIDFAHLLYDSSELKDSFPNSALLEVKDATQLNEQVKLLNKSLSKMKSNDLPNMFLDSYQGLVSNYNDTFKNFDTQATDQFIGVWNSYNNLKKEYDVFISTLEFDDYKELQKKKKDYVNKYKNFSDSENLCVEFKAKYNAIYDSTSHALNDIDYSTDKQLFSDMQAIFVFYYNSIVNGFSFYEKDREQLANFSLEATSQIVGDHFEAPLCIQEFIKCCSDESLQALEYVKEHDNQGHPADTQWFYDVNTEWKASDYNSLFYYNTSDEEATLKNAECLMNILQAYLILL